MSRFSVDTDFAGRVIAPVGVPRVRVFDTTLRDGEQTPGVRFTQDDKVFIASALEATGADAIEAGFPASSPGDFAAVQAVAIAARDCEVVGLARASREDIEAAAEALKPARQPVIHVVFGVSDIHLEHKYGISRSECLRRIESAVAYAHEKVAKVQFSFEDATRSDRVFLRQVVGVAIDAGATRINIADTVGCALPDEFGACIADTVQVSDGRAIVSAHCHDDIGMATANSIAAIQRGATQVEVAVNGIGERAGNASLEEVAVACAVKGIAHIGIRLSELQRVSKIVAERAGVAVQSNKAVVGANAFAHSSGIHQDGLMKQRETYEFIAPAMVGVDGHRFVLTARSGRAAIVHEATRMGFSLKRDQIEEIYGRFVQEADRLSTGALRARFEAIVRDVYSMQPTA